MKRLHGGNVQLGPVPKPCAALLPDFSFDSSGAAVVVEEDCILENRGFDNAMGTDLPTCR